MLVFGGVFELVASFNRWLVRPSPFTLTHLVSLAHHMPSIFIQLPFLLNRRTQRRKSNKVKEWNKRSSLFVGFFNSYPIFLLLPIFFRKILITSLQFHSSSTQLRMHESLFGFTSRLHFYRFDGDLALFANVVGHCVPWPHHHRPEKKQASE